MKVKRAAKAKPRGATAKEVKELTREVVAYEVVLRKALALLAELEKGQNALQETVTRIGNSVARAVEFQARVTVLEGAQVELAKRLEKVETNTKPEEVSKAPIGME